MGEESLARQGVRVPEAAAILGAQPELLAVRSCRWVILRAMVLLGTVVGGRALNLTAYAFHPTPQFLL